MTITTEVDTRGADTLSTKKLGNLGEDIAADILARAGYEILERNFRTRHGEIDIVALDGDTLVFIEVKTRRSLVMGSAVEAVDSRKVRKLRTMIGAYFLERSPQHSGVRLDAFGVFIMPGGHVDVTHLKAVGS